MLKLSANVKHSLHCILLLSTIIGYELLSYYSNPNTDQSVSDLFSDYSLWTALAILLYNLLNLLSLPMNLFSIIGLLLYNAFKDDIKIKKLKSIEKKIPFLCIRVVTRGDYPQLVRKNVDRNMKTCLSAGLRDFIIEVVTDRAIGLKTSTKIRELVVPDGYRTKSGALFKARALQYCLDDGINTLKDNDWIVHLDEETVITKNSVNGIINFVRESRHQFGQGVITYGKDGIVNWWTTLAESYRVAEDLSVYRLQFSMFHKPLFAIKGSYIVANSGAERSVTFDNNGPNGSVCEDIFMAFNAYRRGYTFDFIEGEMYEKSTFTVWDFIRQRKRWIQGLLLLIYTSNIEHRYLILLEIVHLSMFAMYIQLIDLIYPVPTVYWCQLINRLTVSVVVYQQLFGTVIQFDWRQIGIKKFILCLVGSVLVIPFNYVCFLIVILYALLTKKHEFFVVQK
ncbi:beta-1,4-mannosyltransferase egh-like [Oppia nitens]|uniref:beta-1,4-mannosyltransferase egh-like n=1 Tax=Oppia nitens TaxID=1686743 RepID=UPI0023DACEC2|nr:beta-1,4-mannosyltransferase egh-like [Oppia nitens]